MKTKTQTIKHLVACPQCKRQYDVTGMEQGNFFRCLCGELIKIQAPQSYDASIIRCSWCGAPRKKEDGKCEFCGSEFTIHEKDMHTICPNCMARISDIARFCHHCGTPIAPEGSAGDISPFPCPSCGEQYKLTSRRLADSPVSILECTKCAGMWLGNEVFEFVIEKAKEFALPPDQRRKSILPQSFSYQKEALYRKCPVCSKIMNRKNYGRISGVIVDICHGHGIWFDAGELQHLIEWVKSGGLAISQQLNEEEKKEEMRNAYRKEIFEKIAPPHSYDGNEQKKLTIFEIIADVISDAITSLILKK